ncbi:MAG: hypothetical protein H5U07_06525 [Candidatus Aminicenantes bacterium]|nr:hypothetical protein [Candidatus Aminicenantes bacterium]
MRNKARKMILIFLGTFFLVVMAITADQVLKSQRVEEPKKIDAQDSDWKGANFLSFGKAGVDYAVAHDDNYLYLILIFRNREGLTTAEATGFNIYLSQPGKKKKDVGFHFQKRTLSAEEAIAKLESYGETITEERKALIREKKMFVFFEGEPIGKKLKEELEKVHGNHYEPAVFRFRVDSIREPQPENGRPKLQFNKAVFECRIPRKILAGLPSLLEPGKPVNVGIEWGGMTEEMRKALMARRAAEASRATATDTEMVVSGMEAREGGFDRGAGSLSFRQVPKKFSFWFTLQMPAE